MSDNNVEEVEGADGTTHLVNRNNDAFVPGVNVLGDPFMDTDHIARMMASPTEFTQEYLSQFLGQPDTAETRERIGSGVNRAFETMRTNPCREIHSFGGRRAGRTQAMREQTRITDALNNYHRTQRGDLREDRHDDAVDYNNDIVDALNSATYAAMGGRTPEEQRRVEEEAVERAHAELETLASRSLPNDDERLATWQRADNTDDTDLVYGIDTGSGADYDGDVIRMVSTPSGENHFTRAWTDSSSRYNGPSWTDGRGRSRIFNDLPNLIKDEGVDVLKEALKDCDKADISRLREACASILNGD